MSEPRKKFCYVGAPKIFELELACRHLLEAYKDPKGICGIYLVGSVLERPDWRDVDVRFMLDDKTFQKLFPKAGLSSSTWEWDARWLITTSAISLWLKEKTGLPIDFQFQAMTHANEHHKGMRHALGLRIA